MVVALWPSVRQARSGAGCTPGAGTTSGPHAPTRNQLKTYDVEPAQVTTETLRSYGAAFCW